MCLALQVRWWAACCNWGTQSSRQAHVAGQEDRQPATKNRARGACGGTIVGRHREVRRLFGRRVRALDVARDGSRADSCTLTD